MAERSKVITPYNFHYEPGTKEVVVILPGSSGGMNQSLVRGVFDAAANQGLAVATFDYPFFVNDDSGPSDDLSSEMEAFADMTAVLHEMDFREMHVIGKSLGAIVASRVLAVDVDEHPEHAPSLQEVRFTILGLVIKDICFDGLRNVRLDVIQGEHDRFGSPAEVYRALQKEGLSSAHVTGIKEATHSFRDAETDSKPVHEAEAIAAIRWFE